MINFNIEKLVKKPEWLLALIVVLILFGVFYYLLDNKIEGQAAKAAQDMY